jgi:ring-1,2-phenylacetyl-CoA epoxidase subunit PaaA
VPQIRELGLEIPDPGLRYDEAEGGWLYTEPDWDELRQVVSGRGPASADRLELRRRMRDANAWVRRAVLADAA